MLASRIGNKTEIDPAELKERELRLNGYHGINLMKEAEQKFINFNQFTRNLINQKINETVKI